MRTKETIEWDIIAYLKEHPRTSYMNMGVDLEISPRYLMKAITEMVREGKLKYE